MNLAAWLISLVAPMVVRGIIALGFTAVTFTGVSALSNTLVQTAQEKWSAMPATVIQLASLSGIPESLGMVFGALISVMALKASVGFSRYVLKR